MEKTFEEVKDGLNHCRSTGSGCENCPYQAVSRCIELLTGDAADIIYSLEETNDVTFRALDPGCRYSEEGET